MNNKPSYRATHRRDPLPPLDDSAFVDAPNPLTIEPSRELIDAALNYYRDGWIKCKQEQKTPGVMPQARLIVVCCVLSTIATALAFFRR